MPELRVLTYNVRSLRDDQVAVAEVIRSAEPDVVAVQEAPRFLRWRSKRAQLARRSGLVVATADRVGGLLIMTTIAAKVRGTHFARLPKSPRLEARAVSAADIEVRGARWTIAGVHFSTSGAERASHLDPLWRVLEALPGPLVVAGDINEEPGRPAWDGLVARLQDAFAVAGNGPAPTSTARQPRRQLDGIFADRSLEVVDCRVLHDVEGADRASDHLPVLAILRQP